MYRDGIVEEILVLNLNGASVCEICGYVKMGNKEVKA